MADKDNQGKGLRLTREFDATASELFRTWTVPNQVAQWWGPAGFKTTVIKWDTRPGGEINLEMHSPDGKVYPMTGEFREIDIPKRLVFIGKALDEKRKELFETLTTVEFADKRDKSTLTIRIDVTKLTPDAAPFLKGMKQGWNQQLDRLAEYSSSKDVCDTIAGNILESCQEY